MPETSIDDVIQTLTRHLDVSQESGSRLGYFQALYRGVTVEIARGIQRGGFSDPSRMERLDVHFAKRYIDALECHQRGEPTTRSWEISLRAAGDDAPIVLQHLLLAMNAHINLDLGIAAARTAPGKALPSLRADFNAINDVLASLVDELQRNLARVWPLLRPLDWLAGRTEERLVGFSMTIARDSAWRFAESLAFLDEREQEAEIDRMDRWIAVFGAKLHRPVFPLSIIQRAVRVCERGTVSQIIDWLR